MIENVIKFPYNEKRIIIKEYLSSYLIEETDYFVLVKQTIDPTKILKNLVYKIDENAIESPL